MKAEDVRSIASKLGNQAWVRHWFYLGYPREQNAAIQLRDESGAVIWLADHAEKELLDMGFTRGNKFSVYGYHCKLEEPC